MSSLSIKNKNGVSILIDKSDLGLLTKHKDGHWNFYLDIRWGYVVVTYLKRMGGNGRSVKLHRLIMNFPIDLAVVHINGNKFDNRKENLQLCTRSEIKGGTAGHGVSLFKGIRPNGKNWAATISVKGKQIYLGTFKTETEAALAYDAAAKIQGGEFRFLNFPSEDSNV